MQIAHAAHTVLSFSNLRLKRVMTGIDFGCGHRSRSSARSLMNGKMILRLLASAFSASFSSFAQPKPGAARSSRLLLNDVRRQSLGQEGIEQAAAGVGGSGETGLQPIAPRHQFINLGDDAVLLSERW